MKGRSIKPVGTSRGRTALIEEEASDMGSRDRDRDKAQAHTAATVEARAAQRPPIFVDRLVLCRVGKAKRRGSCERRRRQTPEVGQRSS